MRFENLKIAVTGGAGFIGSHLVDQLVEKKNHVVVFDDLSTGSLKNLEKHQGNPAVKVIQGDVRDLASLEKAFEGVDIVFHLATNCVRVSLMDPVVNHHVNATGTLHTLIAAQKNRVKRFVYCSSSEVYGNIVNNPSLRSGDGLLAENSPKLPTTVYGASKLVGEHYALAFHQTHGLPATVVRPFNAYGPRAHILGPYGEVIPRFAVMIRAGQQPVIFGDGRQTRDFTYVEDTASGLISAGENDALLGDSVNLAHGEEVSILDVARHLSELEDVDFKPRHIDDRPGDIRRLGCDTGKARRVLHWRAETPIRDGLDQYLMWLSTQNVDYKSLAAKLTDRNWTEPT